MDRRDSSFLFRACVSRYTVAALNPPARNVHLMTAESSADDLSDLDDDLIASVPTDSRERAKARGKKTSRRKPPQAITEEDLDEIGKSTERLQKVLASAGLASRRHCEEYIVEGRVTVDGKTVRTLGIKVDPDTQKVCVDGERIKPEKKRHYLVNKPPGARGGAENRLALSR